MDTSNITKIKQLLEQAQELLNSYDNADRDCMLKLHKYESSLPGCLRWGIQASEDILKTYGTKKPSGVETTETYWDCGCPTNFIHPKTQPMCPVCGAVEADGWPDSRINEVLLKGLPL